MIDTSSSTINMSGIRISRRDNAVSVNTPESAGAMVDALAFADPETITTIKDYFGISFDDFVHSKNLSKIKYIYNASKEFKGNMYEFLIKMGKKAGINRFKTNERSLEKLHAYIQTEEMIRSTEDRLKLLKQTKTNFSK
mgnify:CR=1 FL=1